MQLLDHRGDGIDLKQFARHAIFQNKRQTAEERAKHDTARANIDFNVRDRTRRFAGNGDGGND